MFIRGVVAALALMLSVSVTSAASILWFEYPNAGAVPGYNTYDLYLDMEGTWCCSAMFFELSRGAFYQDPWGDVTMYPPIAPLHSPAVVYDTYVMEGNRPDVSVIAGAGDVGGPAGLIFNESTLNVSWGVLGAQRTSGFFKIARITMTTDAAGTWRLATIGSDTPYTEFSGTVADIFPEPGSLVLFVMCAILMFQRSRKVSGVHVLSR